MNGVSHLFRALLMESIALGVLVLLVFNTSQHPKASETPPGDQAMAKSLGGGLLDEWNLPALSIQALPDGSKRLAQRATTAAPQSIGKTIHETTFHVDETVDNDLWSARDDSSQIARSSRPASPQRDSPARKAPRFPLRDTLRRPNDFEPPSFPPPQDRSAFTRNAAAWSVAETTRLRRANPSAPATSNEAVVEPAFQYGGLVLKDRFIDRSPDTAPVDMDTDLARAPAKRLVLRRGRR